jgi:hypothetical protein
LAYNIIQVKRTATAGRLPNTTDTSNTQYIAAGELALNMADGILYTSTGSFVIPVGAKQISNVSVNGAIIANGSAGSSGQVLTSSAGGNVYWSTVTGGSGSVDVNAQYTWSNTQTFQNTISFSVGANAIALTNTTSNWMYWGSAGTDAPTFTTRSAGTKLVLYPALSGSYTDYAIGINSGTLWYSLPSYDSGQYFKWYGGTTQIASLGGTGNFLLSGTANAVSYNTGGGYGTVTGGAIVNSTIIAVGNSSVNVIINSTSSTATANNSLYLNGVLAANYLQNSGAYTISGIHTHTANVVLTGGTISTDPVSNTDIVNKKYADSIASGINFHPAVRLVTNTDLGTVTYNNGTSGVGATLTKTTSFAALVVDTVTAAYQDRILVRSQSSTLQNGVYVVSNTGSASYAWVLTRSYDYDQIGSGTNEIDRGDLVYVLDGAVGAGTAWVENSNVTTIGTDPITFVQFSSKAIYPLSSGTGLTYTVGTNYDGSAAATIAIDSTYIAPYVQNTDSRTLSGNLYFTGANSYFGGKTTHAANLVLNAGISVIDSTGSQGLAGYVLTSNGAANVYWRDTSVPRSNTQTSATSITIDSSLYDQYIVTALASAISFPASTTGSPTNGKKMMIRIKDNGTAQGITWTTSGAGGYRAIGVTLPTTTVVNKIMYVGCIYNSTESFWDVIAYSIQA